MGVGGREKENMKEKRKGGIGKSVWEKNEPDKGEEIRERGEGAK